MIAKKSKVPHDLGTKHMNLSEANLLARVTANEIGCPVMVYKNTTNKILDDYDVAFTLPSFGEQVGELVLPEVKR